MRHKKPKNPLYLRDPKGYEKAVAAIKRYGVGLVANEAGISRRWLQNFLKKSDALAEATETKIIETLVRLKKANEQA